MYFSHIKSSEYFSTTLCFKDSLLDNLFFRAISTAFDKKLILSNSKKLTSEEGKGIFIAGIFEHTTEQPIKPASSKARLKPSEYQITRSWQ